MLRIRPLHRACRLGVLVIVGLAPIAVGPLLAAEVPLPAVEFHLTARPSEPSATTAERYLEVVEAVCRYLATLEDERGAIIDPILHREHQYATPYFAHPVGVLLAAGRAADLEPAGIRAMEHATACVAGGSRAIPDRHGEFFLAPLVEALELYQGHVDPERWQTWRKRLQTPLADVLESLDERTNNWRTYAMKGQWLRARFGLVDRDEAGQFIADAWQRRTQRERIVADRWNFYQDWSSDPQSHAVEAVGRGNLLALLAAGYDGPHHAEIAQAVRRGTEASLFWQDPSGQCPPNGRTDNHVFNDVLYQLAFELAAEDALKRGDAALAGRFRRAAGLSFASIRCWRRADDQGRGSYFVTKNHFDPADRVGYQPASQVTNYNGAIAYHLAEAYRARRSPIAEQAAPAEIGGYVVAADPRFASAVANAGGMQLMANLRGDTVTKYGMYWTPLGVVRFARSGWDSRLGPPDGVRGARAGQAASFAPSWQVLGRWVRLADQAEHYRGTLVTEFVHPLLVRFHLLYHTVTGSGGPTFRHEFVVTPDGVLTTLHCLDQRPFGLTVPLVVDDGRRLDVHLAPQRLACSYPRSIEPAGDEQNFLLLGAEVAIDPGEPIRSAVGWLRPVRVTSGDKTVAVFVYPRSAGDPQGDAVRASFRLTSGGFESLLGRVDGDLYVGRTAAGGHAHQLDIDGDGTAEIEFSAACNFLVQLRDARPLALETDRAVEARWAGRSIAVEPFTPVELTAESR